MAEKSSRVAQATPECVANPWLWSGINVFAPFMAIRTAPLFGISPFRRTLPKGMMSPAEGKHSPRNDRAKVGVCCRLPLSIACASFDRVAGSGFHVAKEGHLCAWMFLASS